MKRKQLEMQWEQPERAILMAIAPSQSVLEEEVLPSLRELESLTETCGGQVVAWVTQIRPARDPAVYLGSGKLEEILQLRDQWEADLLICDEELSGSQIRNLEAKTGMRVLDRTFVILDIFAKRARSREGRLQVELAQQRYRLTRLVQQDPKSLSRLGGGIGTRGPGETQLETDRRHIRRRIQALERDLEAVSQHRDRTRRARKREGRFVFAVVGYTNAGKSTLVNALCRSDVLAENRLFATLDPTIRVLGGPPLGEGLPRPMLVDTVGLIRRLPHTLVRAFESTLQEAREADALLHVLDASDPQALRHWEVTEAVLRELGAGDLPVVHVWNQVDKGISEEQHHALCARLHQEGREEQEPLLVSALTGKGMDQVREALATCMKRHYLLQNAGKA